jgi:hypothetical protein
LCVNPLGVEVDAQMAEDHRSEVSWCRAGVFHVVSLDVCAADHLAVRESSAGQEH